MSQSTLDLVLLALQKGLMIHGMGDSITDARYPNPVFSVMVTATTKKKIVVYAASNHESHEEAVRTACASAIERADSVIKPIRQAEVKP